MYDIPLNAKNSNLYYILVSPCRLTYMYITCSVLGCPMIATVRFAVAKVPLICTNKSRPVFGWAHTARRCVSIDKHTRTHRHTHTLTVCTVLFACWQRSFTCVRDPRARHVRATVPALTCRVYVIETRICIYEYTCKRRCTAKILPETLRLCVCV